MDISIPPGHRPGDIEWPTRGAQPGSTFAVLDQHPLNKAGFLRYLSRDAARKEIGLFVHGYNIDFDEAVYRLAQMSADGPGGALPVLFSWPSRATVSGYLADKEGATSSRHQLASFIVDLASVKPGRDLTVFAHSMGCWLLMEALRDLKLGGRDDILARLKVYLASPDIGESVLQSQVLTLGTMKTPITIFVSKDDLALKTSELLTGTRRVGALDLGDPSVVALVGEGVRVIDMTAISPGDPLAHDRYATLAKNFPWRAAALSGRHGLRDAGALVFNAAGSIVSSPLRIGSTIIER